LFVLENQQRKVCYREVDTMKMELFWISGSPPAWRVMLALEVKGINYISRQLDASVKEHKSEEFLKLNPRGQVPVLLLDDIVVRESLAIIAFLDKLQPTPTLLGDDAVSTATIWQWLMDFENNLRPALATVAQSIFRNQVEERQDEIMAAVKIIQAEIQNINRQLSGQNYLCGNSLSAADITLYPSIRWLKRALENSPALSLAQELTNSLNDYTALIRWERLIEALPGYDRTYPPHWRAS
jgi:glutathione S-transferase